MIQKYIQTKSEDLFNEAVKLIPGATSSPFRSFKTVGGIPRFLVRGNGPYVYDADENKYIDYVCGWEALILGHTYPQIVEAMIEAIQLGSLFGAPHPWEVELAKSIKEAVPSMEMVRFVNSGTEAVASAIRLARGFTKRTTLIRFEGSYHGHVDSLIEVVGTEHHMAWGLQEAGIPLHLAAETLTIPYNDVQSLHKTFSMYPATIAAVILEPVCGSIGVVPASMEFIEALKTIPSDYGALVIFDEVMTGFRLAYGGAQEFFKTSADITCLGKALGGGFPIGAYGGRKEIMEQLLPEGTVYQAGTFSGNPVTMRSAIQTLSVLKKPNVYAHLEELTNVLATGIIEIGKKANIAIQVPHVGSLFSILFTLRPVNNYSDSRQINTSRYAKFFHEMLLLGHYFPPSPWDAACISLVHTENEVRATLEAAESVITSL